MYDVPRRCWRITLPGIYCNAISYCSTALMLYWAMVPPVLSRTATMLSVVGHKVVAFRARLRTHNNDGRSHRLIGATGARVPCGVVSLIVANHFRPSSRCSDCVD